MIADTWACTECDCKATVEPFFYQESGVPMCPECDVEMKLDERHELKLYVWHDSLDDYTSGVMFAIASDADQARDLIRKSNSNSDSVENDLRREPSVYDSPVGFAVWGGG